MGRSADIAENRAGEAQGTSWETLAAVIIGLLALVALLGVYIFTADGMAVRDSVPPAGMDSMSWMSLAAMAAFLLAYIVALFKISDRQRHLAVAQAIIPQRRSL